MEAQGAMKVQFYFLTSAQDGGVPQHAPAALTT